MISVSIENCHPDLLVGVVESRMVPGGPADAALDAEIKSALARRADATPSESVKSAIRDLLRAGGYKPAGRGKPASEYLAQAAERGEFPRISHMVDALNLVSLESGLPISLLDAGRSIQGTIQGTGIAPGFVIRLGHPGEAYVFNAAGHEIQIEGLISVARNDGTALGNPVKDSMMAKTNEATTHTIAFIWASRRAVNETELRNICERLARLLRAVESEVAVIG
jgi:DNA/RNA-binding domain of Phe-tRNA-synthetase-like protein